MKKIIALAGVLLLGACTSYVAPSPSPPSQGGSDGTDNSQGSGGITTISAPAARPVLRR